MRVLIMGCGRVGARLAVQMDAEGHDVTVVDIDSKAFTRLPPSYKGYTMTGDATDISMLTTAGIESADVFVAVTQGDNRNIMAAQVAKQIYGVSRVVCRIYDPLRQELFQELGLQTFSPTTVLTSMIHDVLER